MESIDTSFDHLVSHHAAAKSSLTYRSMQSNTNATTANRPRNPLMDDLHKVRDLYTDYTLVCGSQEFKVHRLILHLQSTTFAAAFAGPFKEGQTSVAPEDRKTEVKFTEPEIVQAMLDWFYTFDYGMPETASRLAFHLEVYALADYYGAAGLVKASQRQFEIECEGDKWTVSDLAEAVEILEQRPGMIGRDRLRSILLAAIKANLRTLLSYTDFAVLMSDFKLFNVELLRLMASDAAQPAVQPAFELDDNALTALAISPPPPGFIRGRGGAGAPGRGGRGRGSSSGGRGW